MKQLFKRDFSNLFKRELFNGKRTSYKGIDLSHHTGEGSDFELVRLENLGKSK